MLTINKELVYLGTFSTAQAAHEAAAEAHEAYWGKFSHDGIDK
jgi:hypothetical protein